METQINFFSVLPPQIIRKITSRLPIKSIINCMLVCKLWHNQIPNPFVAKTDVQFLFYNFDSPNFGILDDDSVERHVVPEDVILMNPPSLPSHFRYAEQVLVPIDRFRLRSCNGLLCFSVKNMEDVYLCNPITGECVPVPKPRVNQFYCDMHDLGFCPSTNQYKLLRFVAFDDDDTTELEIYTIGSSAGWRRHIGDVPSRIWNKSEAAICAKGVLHWLLFPEKTKRSILTFDLAEEKFGSLPLPRLNDAKEIYKLGYMDDCLVVTAGHNPPLGLEIWAKKECGVQDSVWTKNWVVDATDSLNQKTLYTLKLKCLIPKKLSTDGRIFLTYLDEELYCYDPRDRLVIGFTSSNLYFGSLWPSLIAYTATHVSPKKLMQGGSSKKYKGKGERKLSG